MSLKLTLSKRPAQIGSSINTRTEKHGEEDVPGIDVPVTDIFLDADELGIILQTPAAHDCLFMGQGGGPDEPRFRDLAPLTIEGKLENAKVVISVDEHQLLLKPAQVKSIKLEPQVGGLTRMSCTVQGNPSANTDVLELLNAKCRIAITGASYAEKPEPDPELPLEHQNQGQSDGDDDQPDNSRTGRIVNIAARKRAKKK